MNHELEASIKECHACARMCTETLSRRFLEVGGKHSDLPHIPIMLDCVEACNIAANFMMRNSPQYQAACRLCAEVCSACAKSCEGASDMSVCAETCNR